MHNKRHGELHIVAYAAMHLLVCYRLTCLDGENKKLSQVKYAIQVLQKKILIALLFTVDQLVVHAQCISW